MFASSFCHDRKSALKPGLHIVVTIAEHVSDDALKGILRLLTHRLQIFLVDFEYLRLLQLCEDQSSLEKLKKCLQPMLEILTTYMETRLTIKP